MDPQPQPWRVLEAPPADPDATATPAARAGGVTPRVVGALVLAAVLGIAAIVVATSSLGGATVDAAGQIAASSGSSETGAAGTLVVDVAGAVVRPGVYHLSPGARIADAIAAAGGFAPRVDAARVAAQLNLAAVVRDGDRIVVPGREDAAGDPTSTRSGPGATPGLVDLNRATAEELDALPGIGPVTAAKIVAARQEQPFRTVDELRSRGLVGERAFERLKSLVAVG